MVKKKYIYIYTEVILILPKPSNILIDPTSLSPSVSVSLSPSVLKHLHTWKTSPYQAQHYKYSCSARSDHFVCSCSTPPLPRWLLMEYFCVHLNGSFLCCRSQILFLQECSMSSPCSDKKPGAKPPPCVFEYINLTSPGLSLGNGSDFTQMTPGHFTQMLIWTWSRLFSRRM